ncbi:MAG: hypothetical protein HOV81_33485 [Kofleriaceae bacterium]|nr:hypothetical protein [Kofleriaceae bacterium]
MKRHLLALALVAAIAAVVHAESVPTTVSFAARLVDDKTDEVLDGDHVATFALFDAETAGTSVWNESHEVTAEDGMVYVDLGSKTPLDGNVLDGRKLWLQVSLDGAVMEPRISLASVPYAMRSASAAKADDSDKVGGVGIDGLQAKITGTCNAGQYLKSINADGSVECADDSAGTGDITAVVAGPGLTGGAMTGAATVGLMSCSSGSILKSTGTGWTCASDADSGGDITGVLAGSGLVGGGSTGDITIGLPTSCGMGQMLKWNGSAWSCAADLDTNSGGTITGITTGAGTGLMGGGTAGGISLSLTNTCASGQVLKWLGSSWVCSSDLDSNSGGTITGITAGTGLTGGGASGSVTVNVGQGVGVVVGADTIGLDTAYTDSRYLMLTGGTLMGSLTLNGNLTMGGNIDMVGRQITNRGCPAGYTSVGGTLCVETTDVCCYTFSAAANRCRGAGSHLCSSVEMRAALLSGVTLTNGLTQDWMADQDADDSALYVNSTDTTNPEGARATTTASWSRCCVVVE